MAIYLDPKNDLTFKKVFGEHKHLCISLINSLLKFTGENEVKEIEYNTGELIPEIPALKDSIVDVRCKAKDGREFLVEMQLLWSNSFKSRVLLNSCKAYVKQLDAGQEYRLAQPVYSLNLVNEIFEPDVEDYYHNYKIVNIEHTDRQIKGLEFVFVELPKYKAPTQEHQDYFDLWLSFLTQINERTEEIPKSLTEKSELKEAVQYLRESAYTKSQLEVYDKYRDIIMTNRAYIVDAFSDGELIGEARGIEKGIAEGRAEGIAEGAKSIISLLESGMSLEEAKRKLGL